MQNVLMLQNNRLRLLMAFTDNAVNFLVDRLGYILAVTSGMSQISADKYFIVIIPIADQSELIGHTIFHYHTSGCRCGTFDIIGCTCGNISEDDLLCDTSA